MQPDNNYERSGYPKSQVKFLIGLELAEKRRYDKIEDARIHKLANTRVRPGDQDKEEEKKAAKRV